jgi:hypothetical protein
VTARELELRRRIMVSFAETGRPPVIEDVETLNALVEKHVVALDESGEILMAHPFAAHRAATRVQAGGRTWWGNCAWDGLGIVAALGLHDAEVHANGVELPVREREPRTDAFFHVAVRAARWWEDIVHT